MGGVTARELFSPEPQRKQSAEGSYRSKDLVSCKGQSILLSQLNFGRSVEEKKIFDLINSNCVSDAQAHAAQKITHYMSGTVDFYIACG